MLGIAAVALMALLWPQSRVLAACAPTTGVVVPGDTVVCSGNTVDQDGTDGYGTGAETGLTINVLSGATVTGTDNGINLDTGNTVNNAGTITSQGDFSNGILSQGTLTVVNSSTGIIRALGSDSTGIAAASLLVTNYGTISATGANSDAINSTFGAATATVNNYGTITGTARAINAGTGIITNYAGGIIQVTAGTAISLVDGSINNAGAITGTTGAISGQTLTITNSGTIRSNGTIATINLNDGTITNSGVITSTAANGTAIGLNNNVTLNNSGTIAANAAFGRAVFVNNGGFAAISNTGLISATGTNGQGISVGVNGQASIVNSGTIVGRTGVSVVGAVGLGTSLVNAGTIIGTGGTAIDFSASDSNTLTVLTGSRIIGQILLGTNDTVTVRTGGDISSLLTLCACGGITTSVTGGLPYAINGSRIAVLEPTAIGLVDRNLSAFTGMISSLVGSRFNEAGASGQATSGVSAFAPSGTGVAELAGAAFDGIPALMYAREHGRLAPNATVTGRESGVSVWSRAFAGARHQRADGIMLASDTLAYGGVLGADKSFGQDSRAGAFIGAGRSKLDVDLNSQSVGTDYVFGGVYARINWMAHFLDVSVTGGHTSSDSTRLIAHNLGPNGLETATASYDGWFVSPEIAYGVRIPVAANIMLMPSLKLRYVGGHQSAYTETGSEQTLTVSSRTFHSLEERIEFALSRIDEMRGNDWLKTTVTLGLLGIERLGGNTVNTVLIGQNLSFAAPGDDIVGGVYTGIGIEYRASERVSVFAAGEGTLMTDHSVLGTAKAGVRVAFGR